MSAKKTHFFYFVFSLSKGLPEWLIFVMFKQEIDGSLWTHSYWGTIGFVRFKLGKISLGNIVDGPGSYYVNDPSITQMFPEITTEMEAWMMIRLLAQESVDNPPVMWQLTNPWKSQVILFCTGESSSIKI